MEQEQQLAESINILSDGTNSMIMSLCTRVPAAAAEECGDVRQQNTVLYIIHTAGDNNNRFRLWNNRPAPHNRQKPSSSGGKAGETAGRSWPVGGITAKYKADRIGMMKLNRYQRESSSSRRQQNTVNHNK